MCEQAKSFSRETFRVKAAPFYSQAEPGWVSITLMVARQDSYQDFHKEGLQTDYHGDCDCALFRTWTSQSSQSRICKNIVLDSKVSSVG